MGFKWASPIHDEKGKHAFAGRKTQLTCPEISAILFLTAAGNRCEGAAKKFNFAETIFFAHSCCKLGGAFTPDSQM